MSNLEQPKIKNPESELKTFEGNLVLKGENTPTEFEANVINFSDFLSEEKKITQKLHKV